MKKKLLTFISVLISLMTSAQVGSIAIVSIPDQIEAGKTVDLKFTYTSNVTVTFSAQLFQTQAGNIKPDYNKYVEAMTKADLPADTNGSVTISFKVPTSTTPSAQLVDRQYTFDLKLTDASVSPVKDFGYSNGTEDHTVVIVPSTVPVDYINFVGSTTPTIHPGDKLTVSFEYTLADSGNVKAGLAIYDANGGWLRNASVDGKEVANYYSKLSKTTTTSIKQTAEITIPTAITTSASLAAGEAYKVVVTIFTPDWKYKTDKKNDIIVEEANSVSDEILNTFKNDEITIYNINGVVIGSGKLENLNITS